MLRAIEDGGLYRADKGRLGRGRLALCKQMAREQATGSRAKGEGCELAAREVVHGLFQ